MRATCRKQWLCMPLTIFERKMDDLGRHLVLIFCVDSRSSLLWLEALLNHLVDDLRTLWVQLEACSRLCIASLWHGLGLMLVLFLNVLFKLSDTDFHRLLRGQVTSIFRQWKVDFT